jgi:hypothetical protein
MRLSFDRCMGVPLRDFAFGRDSLDGRLHYPRFGHYRFAQIAAVPNLIFADSGWLCARRSEV